MTSAAAKAGAAGAVILLVGGVSWLGFDHEASSGIRTNGPIESFTDGGTGEVSGTFDGEMIDWAEISLVNPTDSPAVIIDVKLLAGYGSQHLIETHGIFVLGLKRSFGGGSKTAPSGKAWWGVKPVPAIGYEVPTTAQDPEGRGVVLMLRLGIGEHEDASFIGVEVSYTWQGDEYKARFNQAVLLCHHDEGETRGQVGICRGEHPPPPPLT